MAGNARGGARRRQWDFSRARLRKASATPEAMRAAKVINPTLSEWWLA